MDQFFAFIYDTLFGVYDPKFVLIYQTLFSDGGYVMFGADFIIIPLIFWLVFYYLWRYPYGKLWHWLTWLLVSVVIVLISTWAIAQKEIFDSNNQALIQAMADPQTGYRDHAAGLPIRYALINSFLALCIGFIYSIILKQFSRIQMHLPF